MRHKKRGRNFTKIKSQQKALLRSLSSSLILNEKIMTTEAKAKELRSFIEKVITQAKKNTLAMRRLLLRNFPKEVVGKLFKEIRLRYSNRSGGYTRITKVGARRSDGAQMVIIELLK